MAENLPQAGWTKREDLSRLVTALGPDNVRWVGGCVRDTLLGIEAKDIDAATPLLPAQVIDRCREGGIRTVPTGIDHGTVTALLAGGPVEITTLRHDVSTDGRRATVAFATDWREDAARRDFTINALYAHPETLDISDYFGGMGDLAARRVRFIGDAGQRIGEDHLRILRYFRFQARFGADWDAEALAACEALAPTLKGLSRERVSMELLNLLGLPDPSPAIARMCGVGVLPVILPEAGKRQVAKLAELVAAENASGIEPDPIRRLAALVPLVPAVAESVAARLRMSRGQRERLACVARRGPEDCARPRALAYRAGTACALDRVLLCGGDPAPLRGWKVPRFPLKGGAIIARGVAAGPEVARMLQAVEARWIDEGFPDQARVEALLDEVLAASA